MPTTFEKLVTRAQPKISCQWTHLFWNILKNDGYFSTQCESIKAAISIWRFRTSFWNQCAKNANLKREYFTPYMFGCQGKYAKVQSLPLSNDNFRKSSTRFSLRSHDLCNRSWNAIVEMNQTLICDLKWFIDWWMIDVIRRSLMMFWNKKRKGRHLLGSHSLKFHGWHHQRR